MDKCCVYWIRHDYHIDILSEGYIGITNDFNRRIKEHQRLSDFCQGESLVFSVLLEGDRDYCAEIEKRLRPHSCIGWNSSKGGVYENYDSLRRRSRLFYSKNYNQTLSIKQWSDFLRLDYDSLRKRVEKNPPHYSIDHSIMETKSGSNRSYVNHTKRDLAVYYLENTAMLPTSIAKTIGWQDPLCDLLHGSVSSNLYSNAKIPLYNGEVILWVKRQQTIYDFEIIEGVYHDKDVLNMREMSEKYQYSVYTLRKLVNELNEERYA